MLRKCLAIAGKRTGERFRQYIGSINIQFLEEEQVNAWAFYDNSSAEWETSVREILDKLDIIAFRIDTEE